MNNTQCRIVLRSKVCVLTSSHTVNTLLLFSRCYKLPRKFPFKSHSVTTLLNQSEDDHEAEF